MLKKLIKQGSHFNRCLLLLLIVIGLYSCEFESDNLNYVHVEKPDDQIQLGIDLAGVNPTELIYIYNQTYFTYSLYTDDRAIFARQFYLDGVPIETDQYAEGVHLNILDNQIHDLKLVIALRSGTGSLADKAMYEMYTGVFTFKVKAIPFSDKLNIRQTVNSNNNLKLEWDKPSGFEVSAYNIYKGYSTQGVLLTTITNPNETSFVDTDYAYGYKSYTIVAVIKNSFNLTVQEHISITYSNMSENNFEIERIATDEASVQWENPNPFPCKYVLEYGFNKEKIIVENGVNEATIPISDFPTWSDSFSLYILPQSADINRYEEYSFVRSGYKDKKNNAEINLSYNLKSHKLHGLGFTYLNSYDISTMKEVSTSKHNLQLHSGNIVKVSKEGIVAIIAIDNTIHVYSDYTLNQKIATLRATNNLFHFVGNDKLLLQEVNGFKIYDIRTSSVLTSKFWKSEYNGLEIVVRASVSADGSYIYVECWDHHTPDSQKEWVELYELTTDNTLKLLETKSIANKNYIQFHPTNNNEAIIQYLPFVDNKFVIVDIITKEETQINGEFMNIDPFTGNVLFRGVEYLNNEHNLYVWDKNYSNEKMKIKFANVNTWSPATLYNSNLFFNDYYVNLSNLKEWK